MSSQLKVEPSFIQFDNAKPGTLYVMTISVRNITQQAQRIRLQAPKSGIFALNYIPSGVVAPGLDLRAEVECKIPTEMAETVFNDKIIAMMGNERVEIPIRAIKPFADIRFDHTIALGNLMLNQMVTKDIYFENVSDIAGVAKLAVPKGSAIKLSTNKLTLGPKGNDDSRQFIRVVLEGKETGPIREMIKVNIVGSVDEMHIDISATVIEQQLTLLTENKQGLLELANFPTIFYGEHRVITGVLVNSGPLPLSYSIKYEDEEEAANGAPQSEEFNYSKSFVASPIDGIVKPFSSTPITFTYAPIQYIPERGFTQAQLKENEEPRPMSRNLKVDCLDINQSIAVVLQGKAQVPMVSINPQILRFGDCPVNDRRDILLTLINKTKLPTAFEFPIVATFKFEPTKGKILANETVSVVASFLPPQLGEFKTTIQVKFANGLKEFPLKVLGESSDMSMKKLLITGTDKLPYDFIPLRKFVDPEEEAQTRLEKRKAKENKTMQLEASVRTMMNRSTKPGFVLEDNKPFEQIIDEAAHDKPSIIDASRERDEIYGTDPNYIPKNDPKATFNEMMFKQNKQHTQAYNEYLQTSHAQREVARMVKAKQRSLAKGAIDFSDPFGVNLGMDRGLEEPVLRIPQATEPLWMTGGAGTGSGATAKKLPVDENRLIQKKYSSQPATQAELRDCSCELSTDDLKLVTASHKVIDFGKVNVGSLSAKNFVVNNSLKHSIMVTIEDLEIELQQSKPLCQIIPEGCMAGFDIYFSSKILGKVKKAFTWKVNNIHIFKVHVIAEVTPIELVMSKNELVMEFPPDMLKPTLTSEIILTNPGNAYADFLWGSVGAFTCDPEKGSIAPGKSSVISITWDPHGGKRTEEEIGLHVSGGVDQVLLVKGVLKETKAEFHDKRLMLGVMAVGTEREIITTINNTGVNPLVYFINPVEDQLGIKIEPMEAFIMPGESPEVKLTITPKIARNYDNASITARVRGGKSISLKLAGSSIIPQIELQEDSFKYGSVTVGHEIRLPFTLKNKSQITATLVLDLSLYPDFMPYLLNMLEEADIASKEFGPVPTTQEDEPGNQILLMNKSDLTSSNRKKKKNVENMWKISIPAHSILHAELIYRPTMARKNTFRLPLYLLGMPDEKSLQREVSSAGIACAITVSNFVTDFGDRVVSRDPLARISYFLETTITNHSQTGVSFVIKEGPEILRAFDGSPVEEEKSSNSLMGSEKQQIFFVSPLKLDLAPGQTTKLRVTFLPQQSCTYSKKLGLFLKDATDTTRPYLNLLCMGSGVYPCMSFSTQHLSLPNVPLGVSSRAVFTLFNHGYASLDIKHRISPNITVPIEVTYPDGNQVGIMVDRIRVVLSAKSDTPIAWSGKVEFYDMDGERFFVNISGCHDNCLLSNYPFVSNYNITDYGFIGLDEQPVQFLPQPQIAELRQLEAKRKEELRKQRSLERLRAVEGKSNPGQESPTKKLKSDGSVSEKSLLKSSKSKKDLNSSDSNQTLSYSEGIDYEKPLSAVPIDQEAVFLLRWLNRHICKRPFEVEKFPYCIIENTGDIVVECLEQMSGKRIANLKPVENRFLGGESRRNSAMKSTSAGGSSAESLTAENNAKKRSSEKGKQIAAADKIVFKYQAILNFLMNNGALLSHINPVSMLHQDAYLMMQEYDLCKDHSVHFTPAMLQSRRQSWLNSWLDNCKHAWLEVLYQSVKVFVFTRLNFQAYAQLPGVVVNVPHDSASSSSASLTKKGSEKGKTQKGGKEKDPTPKYLQASNVFTHGESILLAWLTYHIDHADHCIDEGAGKQSDKLIAFNKRVVDIQSTFQDCFAFCQLLHSHVSDITAKGEPLHGYTNVDRTKHDLLYAIFEDAMLQYHVELQEISYEDIMISSRNLILILLHLYLTLPHLVPKAKIDFQGVLGLPIMKKIELKNPSKKPLKYEVTLKGNPDFGIANHEVLIDAESSAEFLVTLNAHFMKQIWSKLYFWNVTSSNVDFNDPAAAASQSYAKGSTLCFHCVSQIHDMKPVEEIQRQVHLFDYETFLLPVKNPFPRDTILKVKMIVKYSAKTVMEFVGPKSKKSKKESQDYFQEIPLTKPVSDGDDFNDKNTNNDDWDLENLYKQPFWILEESLAIPKNATKNLKVFMLPFLLGKYTCQVVFHDQDQGEFCHHIAAEIILPKPTDKLELNIFNQHKINFMLTFPSKNSTFEKAYNVVSEVRIKNGNKKIRARAIFQQLLSNLVANEDNGQSAYLMDFTANFFQYKRNLLFISEYMKFGTNQHQSHQGTTKGGNSAPNASKYKKVPKTLLDVFSSNSEDNSNSPPPQIGSDPSNKVMMGFFPERAGVYKTTAVIYGEENPLDIRCVELVITAKVPDANMKLEFNGPARKKLLQDIPIKNETDKDWMLSISVGTGNPKDKKVDESNIFAQKVFFSQPKQTLTIPRHSQGNVQVGFYSLIPGQYQGKLVIRNIETNDVFDYALVGQCEESVAEDDFYYTATARKKATFTITLPSLKTLLQSEATTSGGPDANSQSSSLVGKKAEKEKEITEAYRFVVESDLPYMSCAKTIELQPEEKTDLRVTVNSPIGGLLSGMIGLRDPDPTKSNNALILWYTVNIDVTAPTEEKSVAVESMVRQAVVVDITLDNPINEELIFDVSFLGDGLLGEHSFTLPPRDQCDGKNNTYELIYSPLIAGDFIGRVSFWNEIVGELWYKLLLKATPALPIELDLIESMLGTEQSLDAPIENPLNEEVIYQIEVSDPLHFSVQQSKIALSPFMQTTFKISFKPSVLHDIVTGTVRLLNRRLGEVVYAVKGKGLMPGVMHQITIEGPINEIVSESVVFKNPFTHPLPLEVFLDRTTSSLPSQSHSPTSKKQQDNVASNIDEVFSLLMRKTHDLVLAAKTPLHIPVGFAPLSLGMYNTTVQIRANVAGHNLLWCYPVQGIAEMGQVMKLPALKTPSKTSMMRDYIIPLSGIRRRDVTGELHLSDFSLNTKIEDDFLRNLANRTFRIQALEIVPYDLSFSNDTTTVININDPTIEVDFGIRCRLLFEPLRVFTTPIEISIVARNRGKWKARVEIEATDPEPDDVIKLTAAVNQIDRVSFKLHNRFLGFSNFQAYFTSNSSPHFSIHPSTGVLPPFNQDNQDDGMNFVITFAPKEYGVVENATLNILTEDAQWTYLLKGGYPESVAHSGAVRSKLTAPTASTARR